IGINLLHKVRESCNPEIDPLKKAMVTEIAGLDIGLGIKASLGLEGRDSMIIKTGPSLFPSTEMGHPVRNVHIDSIDARSGDLPNTLHVDLAPFGGVRTNPDILIALPDPKG